MKRNTLHASTRAASAILLGTALLLPPMLRAHCDSLDGPVITAAKAALEKKDITPVLKWLKPDAEPEVKGAFQRALAVRVKGAEAQALADQFFFETLVRLHRAGEGAPFTGLKPAGTDAGPAITGADRALEHGDVGPVVNLVTTEAAAGIRKRFAEVQEKKKHAEHNVAAGREYVAAYVEYVHYVEGLHQAAQGAALHQEVASGTAAPAEEAQHQHK